MNGRPPPPDGPRPAAGPWRLHLAGLGHPPSPPSARPLVLLHGFTGDGTEFDALAPLLPPDRPTLAVDLLGHGRSPAPDDPRAYTVPATIAAVLATLAEHGVRQAHWLGYSMGGRVALSLAIDHPEACLSLTLVGASPGIADPAERAERMRADDALAADIERDGVEAFVDRWMRQPLLATQAALGTKHLARARARRLARPAHALAHTLRGIGTGAMTPVWDRLGDLAAPTLLVSGALDEKFDRISAAMARRLPDARRLVVSGSGHAVHLEAPGPLAEALWTLLAETDPPGPPSPAPPHPATTRR